jgi:hypothetical protein
VTPVDVKFVQHWLRWFGHIQRRPPETPVPSDVISRTGNGKRGRGRLNFDMEGVYEERFEGLKYH